MLNLGDKILVVCIGNICRSPVGEAFFSEYFKDAGLSCQATSAGIKALVDYPADPHAKAVMSESYGIDISSHRAKQLTEDLLKQHSLILTMDSEQQQFIIKQFPFACGKIQRLGQWKKTNILDPYQQDKDIFEERIKSIKECVQSWIDRLW